MGLGLGFRTLSLERSEEKEEGLGVPMWEELHLRQALGSMKKSYKVSSPPFYLFFQYVLQTLLFM